ncbi:MAG: hypothetical protein RBS27_13950 [Giesbergeria sp.]|jgi:hypothetical protein|nr:hypothetical protein [Giesbergeria sp.]
MTTTRSFPSLAAAAGVALALCVGAAPAQARDVNWSIGVSSPGVVVGVNNGYPMYVAPPPVYVAPRPVYYAPRPVYYSAPPPVYYAPPPAYYYRDHDRGHRHHRHDRHDRGHWDGRR